MKFNFLSKSLPAFGLDVSAESLKLMELQTKGKGLSLKACSQASLPKNLLVNDVIGDPKTFEFILKQNLQKPQFGRFSTNYVVASLPESKSFVRVIQIPKMTESEAENAVPFEAENFIPMPIDQVYLDWQKIGDSGDPSRPGEAGAGKMNILMIASPKEFVDSYLGVLDKVGLKPVALEVESQSCHRAAIAPQSAETLLLLNISALRSTLIMVEDGNLQFTSTIPIAGNSFTESIARSLGVSSAKAEEIKRKVGIANTAEYPNIKTSFLPILNNFTAEIKNILKFHSEHSPKQVERILLMGGGARLQNLPEFLAPGLMDAGVSKIELANPWQVLGTDPPPFDPMESLGFVTAIGLAARGTEYSLNR